MKATKCFLRSSEIFKDIQIAFDLTVKLLDKIKNYIKYKLLKL